MVRLHRWLETNAAVIEGEVVVQNEDGTSDFGALEADLGEGRCDRFVFYAFDLLYLDGFDLRRAPLTERKRVLSILLESAKEPLRFSPHFEPEDAKKLYTDACKLGLEGLVSKRADAPYRSGRTLVWTKVTCRHRDTFYAVGLASIAESSMACIWRVRMPMRSSMRARWSAAFRNGR